MIAIIDADSLIWVAAYLARDGDNPDDGVNSLDTMITEILVATKATQYVGFIKGTKESHRHKMFESYKANRPEKPVWLSKWESILRSHALNYWKFVSVEGYESDDAVASAAHYLYEHGFNYTIVGNDKDLKQIPGRHYNPQKKQFLDISYFESETYLLTQILTGDGTDNIKGLSGIGPAKAKKILDDASINGHRVHCVLSAWKKHYPGPMTLPNMLIDFAENLLKVTLKIDLRLDPATIVAVPSSIQQIAADYKRED